MPVNVSGHTTSRSGSTEPPGDREASNPGVPTQPLHHLDALWIQVAGSRCNLTCTHCFVSCGPTASHHAFMSRDEVRGRVAEAIALGVRELYFTGGEPFLHPEMLEILAEAIAVLPSTLLTNGTLFTEARAGALARLAREARFSLELRVSLDGDDAESHDAFRGAGSFERTIAGLLRLERHGLLPIVTATEHGDEDPSHCRERYAAMLRARGITRPRVKTLPLFRLGREAERARGYDEAESLRDLPPERFDPHRLQCGTSRAVTSRGVFVCPLLVDEPAARIADRLDLGLGPQPLDHGACFTCWVTGMTCGNG